MKSPRKRRAEVKPRPAKNHKPELGDAKQWMTLLAGVAELGLWRWDILRDDFWITDKGCALFGFDSAEKVDLNRFRSRLHPDDREAVLNAVEHAVRSGSEYESEYRVLLPDGQLRWIAERGQVEVDGDTRPVGMRGASVDITRRKQAEGQAARHRDQITHLSHMATLVELSGSIAHELNQPLSAILSNAQAGQRMIANGADINEIREILGDIVTEEKRAGEVIHRLRQWLKKGERQERALNINELVKDVLRLARGYLIHHHVTATTELAENLPAVMGDSVELQQLLVNLIVNARDAMLDCNRAERCVLIRTAMKLGSSKVIVSVVDCGRSIPDESLEQIFEPFFTTKVKGLGLGLSVCRTIIAAHRGQLWATNNPDRGAAFHFSLSVRTPGKATSNS